MGPETQLRMPLADHARVAEGIGRRSFVDATEPLQRVREIKSEAEVAKIPRNAATSQGEPSRGFAGGSCLPARPLSAVFRAFQIALLEEGADWVSYLAGGAGPGGYGDVDLPRQRQALHGGRCPDAGYPVRSGTAISAISDRNFAIGHKRRRGAHRAHAALHAATEAALGSIARACAPGMPTVPCSTACSPRARPRWVAGFGPPALGFRADRMAVADGPRRDAV